MITLLLTLSTLINPIIEQDSLLTTDIEEIVIVSTPKESTRLRQQPLSSTSFSQTEMRQRGIDGMKDLSANVPNLFIPAYGSRLTTSVYIRGIGSRTGTPAVSLYVDGVPQLSPASYDFNFSDVDRIDVLRGPQSTLYGRNSMGGVVRVFTKNPFHYQGTDVTINGALLPSGSSVSGSTKSLTSPFPSGTLDSGAGSVPGTFPARMSANGRATLTHYHRISEHLAFSVNLFGERDGGYFRNAARDGEVIDDQTDAGGRVRLIYRPTSTLSFDITANHEWLRQGGYPYEYRGIVGTPTTPNPPTVGTIAYDNRSGYRRNLTNVGLTIDKQWSHAILTSITGFQHLNDRMDLDQDFTYTNLYTLVQRQNVNTVSEEIIVKKPQIVNCKSSNCKYSWLFGLSAIQQWNTTEGFVTFHDDGLAWLNGLINNQANTHLPTISSRDAEGNEQYVMNFVFNNQILGNTLEFPGTYKTPTTNAAVFHQSTFENLFGAEGLTLTAGLRLDFEHFSLTHDAYYAFNQRYGLDGRLTYPDGSVREGMTLVPVRNFDVDDALRGSLNKSYLQLLPKLTLQWSPSSFNSQPSSFNLFASVSRGYRSSGYNIQMFSDLLQSRMQTKIMQNVADATIPVVEGVTVMPSDAKAKVRDILTSMSEDKPTDVEAATWYKPESSWNFEVGSHLNLFDSRLLADVAAFWMEMRDQQLSVMSSGGLGRVTINSGRSRSIGAEAALRLRATDHLDLQAAYGYTSARFRNATENGNTFVPFMPRHTLATGATYTWQLRAKNAQSIVLHANYRAAGRIYWNEANTAYQNFAGMLNARLTIHCPFPTVRTELSIFANNILATRFQTFYFETMQRGFAQYSRPTELGIELRLRL